jgi:hypothetical protein
LKVFVGSTEYDLKMASNAVIKADYCSGWGDEVVISGTMHPILCDIKINSQIPQQAKEQALFHELVHAMLEEIGAKELSEDEGFVDSFSKQIFSLLKKNNMDKIMSFIGGKTDGKSRRNSR